MALVLTALLGITATVACETPPERPDALVTIRAFTDALSDGDAALASSYTSSPERARGDLEQVFRALNRDGADFVVQALTTDGNPGTTAAFTLGAVWNLGESAYGPREWVFSTSGTARRDNGGWQIEWSPDVVVPGMEEGQQVRFRPQPPDPPEIRDRTGKTMMSQQTVKMVSVDPARVTSPGSAANELEQLLRPIDSSMTRSRILDVFASGRGNPVGLVALREDDYSSIADRLSRISGVGVSDQSHLLTSTATLSSPVFSVLRDLWETRQEESAGWTVELVDAQGSAAVLASEPGIPLEDVQTELDLDVQLAAQDSIDELGEPAIVVAIKPSSGAVLAVAQNAAADVQGPIALTGLYPPGAAFQPITALAAMSAGVVRPDDVVECPQHGEYEDVRVEASTHADDADTQHVPFAEAFAESCETAIAQLATQLPESSLRDMAMRLGLGLRFDTAGLVSMTGVVPPVESGPDRVETAVGQGRLQATPFGMALVAATIARGSVPEPVLLTPQNGARDVSAPTITAQPVEEMEPLDHSLINDLKRMMRGVVTEGISERLSDLAGLIGTAGTADGGQDGERHGWFIGIDGDLAFAVFVEGAGTADAAIDSAGRFLRPLQAGE